jgi:hypothetical protein
MKTLRLHSIAAAAVLALSGTAAEAHVNYTGKDFGTYANGVPKSLTISGFTVDTNAGWADGTDLDFANAHHITFFRFTLADPTLLQITVSASNNGGAAIGGVLPGFSIYSGLAHLTGGADYDTTPVTVAYLATLGEPQPKEGAFRALTSWKMGNSSGTTEADLSTFTYVGHAVDGTAANFGAVAGINGDGLADGTVTGTFTLGPGDYSLVIGGADLPNETAGGNYGVAVTVTTVPEPATAVVLSLGLATVCATRRRHA